MRSADSMEEVMNAMTRTNPYLDLCIVSLPITFTRFVTTKISFIDPQLISRVEQMSCAAVTDR